MTIARLLALATFAAAASMAAYADNDATDAQDASHITQELLASSKTRQQAESEFLQARAEIAAITGEDSGSAYLALHLGE